MGEELGKGRALDEILASTPMVAEGVATAPAVLELARRAGVEMPISETVAAVLAGQLSPAESVTHLMQRGAKSELDYLAH